MRQMKQFSMDAMFSWISIFKDLWSHAGAGMWQTFKELCHMYLNNAFHLMKNESSPWPWSAQHLDIHHTFVIYSQQPPPPIYACTCLDHRAALPWPPGSFIDYHLYFFAWKHNASQIPNCPWRAKIIVYNRPSTCNDKSAMMCFRV